MKHTIEFVKLHGEEECPDDCFLSIHLGYSNEQYEMLVSELSIELYAHQHRDNDNRMLWQVLRDVLGRVDLPDATYGQCVAIGMAFSKAIEINELAFCAIREAAIEKRKLHGGGLLNALLG